MNLARTGADHQKLASRPDMDPADALGEMLIAFTIDSCAAALRCNDRAWLHEELDTYARLIALRSPEQIAHLERKRGLAP